MSDGLQVWIEREPGADCYLIINGTGFPKQGEHSVGLARTYTGTLGRIAKWLSCCSWHLTEMWSELVRSCVCQKLDAMIAIAVSRRVCVSYSRCRWICPA